MSKRVRDCFWIWGHPTNTLYGDKNPSSISPVDGLDFIGAKNVFYNDFKIEFDKKLECKLSKDVAQVGWCIDAAAAHPENVQEIIDMAKGNKNIKIGMFDDFFSASNPPNNYTNYTPELLRKYKKMLNDAGLEMWVVIYSLNYFGDCEMSVIEQYINEFDGISIWFWEEDLIEKEYDVFVEKILEMTPDKKHLIGCYVYNYAAGKPANENIVYNQLVKGTDLLRKGDIDGLILHSNIVFGLREPHKAVDVCKEWLENHGDEIIDK